MSEYIDKSYLDKIIDNKIPVTYTRAHIKPELAKTRAVYGVDYDSYLVNCYILDHFEVNLRHNKMDFNVSSE